MQYDAVYCVMEKMIFQRKSDILIGKASNIDGITILFHFIFIPICILKFK